jgi:hypothetical protein
VPPADDQRVGVQIWLERDKFKVVPGGAESTAFTVKNQGTQVEQFQLRAAGPGWLVIEPGTFSVYPGQEATGTVQAAPPRTPASIAGVTPFRLTATSAIHPNVSASASGQIDVAPFYELTAELAPSSTSGKGWTRGRVLLNNQGNVPLRVTLRPSDIADGLQLRLPTAASVEPGQVAPVPVRVRGRRWFGDSETKSFSLTAEPPRPLAPQRMTGTRTIIPTFRRWVRRLLVFLVVVAIIGIAAALAYHHYHQQLSDLLDRLLHRQG